MGQQRRIDPLRSQRAEAAKLICILYADAVAQGQKEVRLMLGKKNNILIFTISVVFFCKQLFAQCVFFRMV